MLIKLLCSYFPFPLSELHALKRVLDKDLSFWRVPGERQQYSRL